MSQEHVDIVRKITDAFRRGDWDEVSAYIDPHISVRTDPSWPEQRFYGREALLTWWRSTAEEVWGLDIENEEIVDLEDRVLMRMCWNTRGEHSGIEGQQRWSQIVTIRDGRYTFLEYFLDHEQALKALGLSE